MALHRRARGLLASLAVSSLALTAVSVAPASAAAGGPDRGERLSKRLTRAVTVNGVMRHMRAFQRIANTYDGTRAASLAGNDASIKYVRDKLVRAGYDVRYQTFPFIFFHAPVETLTETSPEQRDFAFDTMTFSPPTPERGISAPLAVVPADESTGCEPTDFEGTDFTGTIALIRRGGCSFALKQQSAADAGAAAAVVYNNTEGALRGTLVDPDAGRIPTGGITLAEGELLVSAAEAGEVEMALEVQTIQRPAVTRNVIAESRRGDPDNVVMLGAHLDSVPDGPGINDNGSGSAALLEVALKFAKLERRPTNTVRFAWWGAEEFSVLGSAHYVESLSEAERSAIALYLNFDMVSSPNYAEFVYDGDDSDGVGAPAGPPGSAEIEELITDYLDRRASFHEGTDFDGRSDYGPFIAVGIPAGGTFTGAEDIKTPQQAARYGGTAGVAFDPCYHEACDTIRNVNREALGLNSDVVAHTTAIYSDDVSSVRDAGETAITSRVSTTERAPAGSIAR